MPETVESLTKQIEDARFELSRGVLGLTVPRPAQTLAETVTEVVEEFKSTTTVGDGHKCVCGEDELSWAQREDIRSAIDTLEGLL